jgi:hypothetical protein
VSSIVGLGRGEVASQFPKLFHEYYAIHETIHAILREGNALEPTTIEWRVKETHPELSMGPETLAAAIRQAIKDTTAEMPGITNEGGALSFGGLTTPTKPSP